MKKLLLILMSFFLFVSCFSQQIIKENVQSGYKDSFGFLRTALVGVTTYTDRQFRATGLVVPCVAKDDVFSYNIQINHDLERQETVINDFHIHFSPTSATAANQKVAIDYAWVICRIGDPIPNTFTYTGTDVYTFTKDEQYNFLVDGILENLTIPLPNGNSSFILIKCQRRNDSRDTYTGEIAIFGADCHYFSNRLGSVKVATE